MKQELIIENKKVEVIRQEKIIFTGRDSNYNLIPLCNKICYVIKGKDNYEKFLYKEYPYEIEGKIFYRTEAFPPEYEFKFIEC